MIRRPPRSTQSRSSAASDVYKRQVLDFTCIYLARTVGSRRQLWLLAIVHLTYSAYRARKPTLCSVFRHHTLIIPCCWCHTSSREAISPHFKGAISKRVDRSTRPDPGNSGAVEIAIWRRRRLPIMLDLLFASATRMSSWPWRVPQFWPSCAPGPVEFLWGSCPWSTGIGRTANTVLSFKNDNNIPSKPLAHNWSCSVYIRIKDTCSL